MISGGAPVSTRIVQTTQLVECDRRRATLPSLNRADPAMCRAAGFTSGHTWRVTSRTRAPRQLTQHPGKARARTCGLFPSGEGGIRTLVTLAGKSVFETDAFNHSATSP